VGIHRIKVYRNPETMHRHFDQNTGIIDAIPVKD
jgi:hypothetical protein